jgi:hypothetical protein
MRYDLVVSSSPALDVAAAAWRADGIAHVPGVLPVGLAAELLMGLRRLPLLPIETDHELVWAYDVAVPPVRDPQLFEPLFRLIPVLDEVVPRLASAIVGHALVPHAPTTFRVIAYRKGSWSRGPRDRGDRLVACTLGLGDDVWPAAWGGQPIAPVRGDVLTLIDPVRAPEVPLLVQHVERYELRTLLAPGAA